MPWTERTGRRIQLRDLHILLAVAKSGSMGKAAADLAISQPSISKSIAALEHELGVRLLDRGPQGIEPTAYGRAVLECGTAVFDEIRQGVKALEFLSDPSTGDLRIGSTETMAAGFASAVADRFMRDYPGVSLHLVPGDRDTLLSRELRQRTIELAVAPTTGLPEDGDTHHDVLFDDRFVVMAGSQNPWVRRRKVALSDLLDEPWILPPPESLPGRHIAQTFRANGVEPPRAHVVSFSLPLHHHVLATGRYVTMLPRSMLHFGKHLSLRLLPVRSTRSLYPTGIITLKNRTLSPLAERFIACARDLAKPMARLP